MRLVNNAKQLTRTHVKKIATREKELALSMVMTPYKTILTEKLELCKKIRRFREVVHSRAI